MSTATYSINGDVLQVQESGCALTAWHIDSGSVGDVDVSGLSLVAVSHDDGEGVRRIFFLNEDAGPEQFQVVIDLLQGRVGLSWGGVAETARDVGVYQVPIEIGPAVKVPGRLMLDAAAEEAELWVEIPELDLAWRSSRCAAARARFQVEG
ncbi:MAG TPA: DUF1326 domain-containing protein [Acidimicrobiia bacterium]|jgi:hypothetical protein|nr:DUF1326 domain-containing protein [Acidimicrobiia bacterium]